MTIAARTNVALTTPSWGAPRAVKKLPVAGYAHRWCSKAARQPVGSLLNKIPNLVGSGDMGALGDATSLYPSLATKQSQPVLLGAAGKRTRYVLGAAIPQPCTILFVGGAAAADAAVVLGCSINAYPNSNSTRTRLGSGTHSSATRWEVDAGATLWHDAAPVDANMHVFVLVLNGASSILSIDGVEVTGDAGTNDWFVNGHIGELPNTSPSTPGSTFAINLLDHAIYPRALSATERTTLTTGLAVDHGL